MLGHPGDSGKAGANPASPFPLFHPYDRECVFIFHAPCPNRGRDIAEWSNGNSRLSLGRDLSSTLGFAISFSTSPYFYTARAVSADRPFALVVVMGQVVAVDAEKTAIKQFAAVKQQKSSETLSPRKMQGPPLVEAAGGAALSRAAAEEMRIAPSSSAEGKKRTAPSTGTGARAGGEAGTAGAAPGPRKAPE